MSDGQLFKPGDIVFSDQLWLEGQVLRLRDDEAQIWWSDDDVSWEKCSVLTPMPPGSAPRLRLVDPASSGALFRFAYLGAGIHRVDRPPAGSVYYMGNYPQLPRPPAGLVSATGCPASLTGPCRPSAFRT